MIMDLLDPLAARGGLDSDVRHSIVDEVIDAVNREFPASLLRSPDPAEHEQVTIRIRSRVLPPSSSEQANLSDEISRRVTGLGFLDLLLPPARTDLSEIAIYSSGLVWVMKKGSVRWEDAGLTVDASEESNHPGLISLAIQLGFVGKGVQMQSLLKSLAQTFSDEFIAQVETRAEKLGSSLGVMSAIFYFMPFVITVLVIVGVPLISTISGG